MHDDFWYHAGKEESEQAYREPKVRPIVSVLHDLQRVALEIDSPVEILLVECLHGDLILPAVLDPVLLLSKLQVMLHWPTRVPCLFVLPRRDRGSNAPERDEDRHGSQDGKEDPGEESTTKLSSKVRGNESEQGEENDIRKALASRGVGGKGPVFN